MYNLSFELQRGGIVLFKQVQKDEKESLTLFSLICQIICKMVMLMDYMIGYDLGCFKSGLIECMPSHKDKGKGHSC